MTNFENILSTIEVDPWLYFWKIESETNVTSFGGFHIEMGTGCIKFTVTETELSIRINPILNNSHMAIMPSVINIKKSDPLFLRVTNLISDVECFLKEESNVLVQGLQRDIRIKKSLELILANTTYR